MSIGSFRNKPCYCGSGKKFKKCHIPILDKAIAEGDKLTIEKESPEAYLIMERKIGLSDVKLSVDL